MSRRPQLVGLLWRWHRRIGVLAAFFAVLLAVSGIVLNHSSELGLDRSFIDWTWLHRVYGDHSADLPAFRLGDHWLSRNVDGRIYLDAREVSPCNGELVGVLQAGELWYAGCAEELLLVTRSGELVESITASTGLPIPLTGLGLFDNRVVLQAAGSWWLADLEQMNFSERAPGGAVIQQLTAGQLPAAIRAQLPATGQWLSWERLLLDLHSGRVLGRMGVLLVDVMGALLACLAGSGIAMWWLHRRRRQRRTVCSDTAD